MLPDIDSKEKIDYICDEWPIDRSSHFLWDMRNKGLIAICAGVIALTGCQSDGELPAVVGRITGLNLSLAESSTRTILDYDSEENILKCFWRKSDKVWVSDKVSSAMFSIPEEVEEATVAGFQGELALHASQPAI